MEQCTSDHCVEEYIIIKCVSESRTFVLRSLNIPASVLASTAGILHQKDEERDGSGRQSRMTTESTHQQIRQGVYCQEGQGVE